MDISKVLEDIRKRHKERMDAGKKDEGRWITTKNGHKVHLSEEGIPDKGNPHVIAEMEGAAARKRKDPAAKTKRRASGNVMLSTNAIDVSDAVSENDAARKKGSTFRNSLDGHVKNGKLTPERQKVHDEIMDNFFRGKKPTEGKKKMVMMGGGPASGKGSISDVVGLSGRDPDCVKIDPDEFKAALPGYSELAKETESAAGVYHEESSALAKDAYANALSNGVNAIYDGTGDGSYNSLMSKIRQAKEAGYSVDGKYVTVDVEEALRRNQKRYEDGVTNWERAKQTGVFVDKKGRDILPPRLPDPELVKRTHAKVTDLSVECAKEFDSIEIWDNNGGPGEQMMIATGGNGKGLRAVPGKEKEFQKYLDKGQKKYRINSEGYAEEIRSDSVDERMGYNMNVIGKDVLNGEGNRPADRWNQIINAVNSGSDPETIDPPLGENEWEDYLRMKTDLDEENERIAKRCKEKGIPVWRTGYGMVEKEWDE